MEVMGMCCVLLTAKKECSYSISSGHSAPSRIRFYVGPTIRCPVSVSLIARHGNDCFLLDTLQKQVDIAAKSKSPRNVVTKEEAAEIAKEKYSYNIALASIVQVLHVLQVM
ncbi:hypothetical protein Ahy_B07g088890 [Arachis hypogaea]|uniref:Uncharacterized protein n=1 Tax=Arachis hypogaea TaxID=3818 RepID=A0A444YFQ3_ARAHY|nr:hypothetical protein Ahy_B07g088890 [Arachis hypogaea]